MNTPVKSALKALKGAQSPFLFWRLLDESYVRKHYSVDVMYGPTIVDGLRGAGIRSKRNPMTGKNPLSFRETAKTLHR